MAGYAKVTLGQLYDLFEAGTLSYCDGDRHIVFGIRIWDET